MIQVAHNVPQWPYLMVIHALGHMMYGYTLLVPVSQIVLNKLSREHDKTG